jgi:hypothetical protein
MAGYSSGFEFAARFFTLGLGALYPTLAGTGVLTRAAGGCGSAGAGALAGIDVVAFAGLFGGSSAHRSYGEHGGCGCSKSDPCSFFGCNHLLVPQVGGFICKAFYRYARLEKRSFEKVHNKVWEQGVTSTSVAAAAGC